MRTLYLLRHAKSDWSHSGLDDQARPLNSRGRRGAQAIQRYCSEQEICPSLILCSSAVRTRETLALIEPAFSALEDKPEIRVDGALYLAAAHEIVARIQDAGKAHSSVMVIGHNPGMHSLANDLTGTDACGKAAALAAKFPAAALAEITFAIEDWADIAAGQGALKRYVTLKTL